MLNVPQPNLFRSHVLQVITSLMTRNFFSSFGNYASQFVDYSVGIIIQLLGYYNNDEATSTSCQGSGTTLTVLSGTHLTSSTHMCDLLCMSSVCICVCSFSACSAYFAAIELDTASGKAFHTFSLALTLETRLISLCRSLSYV